jgi:hypothetical protein
VSIFATIARGLGDLWGGFTDRIYNEPVLALGVVNGAIALGLGFGAPITKEQAALLSAAATAVLAFIARRQVTPT